MKSPVSKDKVKVFAKAPTSAEVRRLSLSIGQFIRYWGFRRIHGAIWAQLYLSSQPLNCTQLAANLGLSKALVSPALDELIHHKLIKEEAPPDEKTKVYSAVENVGDVIKHVLKTREAKMLRQITKDFDKLKVASGRISGLSQSRIDSLEGMIGSANLMLQILLMQNDILDLPQNIK